MTACRWVQAECRGLGEHDAPEVNLTPMSHLLLLLLLLILTACRWVQAECCGLGEHDAPEVDPTLTSAVAAPMSPLLLLLLLLVFECLQVGAG
jgi:hypothetical protein